MNIESATGEGKASSPQKLSAVICAYTENRWTEINGAVDSLRRQTVPPLEIILVVDYNPNLYKRARAHFSDILVVENSDTRGLGGARNSGFRAAGGDIIAYLDDDAIAASDWVERIVNDYRNAKVAGVGGFTAPRWEGQQPSWFPQEFNWVIGCSYRGMPEAARPVRNVHGCNMSFRREVLTRLGGFRLGYGCDETEFCIRLQRHWPDMKVLYDPAVRAEHHVSADRGTWRYFCSRCYFEGGSKAVVSWLVGPEHGLASERAYTLQTLPSGAARGLWDAFFARDLSGIGRFAAILVGLASTTWGYLVGRLTTQAAARKRGWTEPAEVGS